MIVPITPLPFDKTLAERLFGSYLVIGWNEFCMIATISELCD